MSSLPRVKIVSLGRRTRPSAQRSTTRAVWDTNVTSASLAPMGGPLAYFFSYPHNSLPGSLNIIGMRPIGSGPSRMAILDEMNRSRIQMVDRSLSVTHGRRTELHQILISEPDRGY